MQIASGKAVGGRVELESELPEGSTVTVLAHEGDETFEADEETAARVLEYRVRPNTGYAAHHVDGSERASILVHRCAVARADGPWDHRRRPACVPGVSDPSSRFRKGRRLSIARPAGLIELSLQMVDLLTQSLVLSAQYFSLAFRAFCALANRVDLFAGWCPIGRPLIRHVDVMPDPRKKYKYGILDRPFNEAGGEARTR